MVTISWVMIVFIAFIVPIVLIIDYYLSRKKNNGYNSLKI